MEMAFAAAILSWSRKKSSCKLRDAVQKLICLGGENKDIARAESILAELQKRGDSITDLSQRPAANSGK